MGLPLRQTAPLVWFAAHGLCQLSSLVVSNVSGGSDKATRNASPCTRSYQIRICWTRRQTTPRQGLWPARLTYTGRPQNRKDPIGLVGSLMPAFGTDDGLVTKLHAFILAHHTFVKNLIQMQGLASHSLSAAATGIPVHLDTILAISSSETLSSQACSLRMRSLPPAAHTGSGGLLLRSAARFIVFRSYFCCAS